MQNILLAIVLAPLFGAIIAGLFPVSRRIAHSVTIAGVGLSFFLSLYVFKYIVLGGHGPYNQTVYTWLTSGGLNIQVGFLIDSLSALMMVVVTFVSWMVHIYTIGYMRDDPGYQRFFSYISLFTFSMLMLVMANNFMQLFFGWEAVGLVSYLLIGFWYTRESAVFANLKAFLVNRVGDFGFLLGIAGVLMYFGSLDYAPVFDLAHQGHQQNTLVEIIPGYQWSIITVICLLLFMGAMGKSAQFPLHVWLPDSMEGPTPISALIHAATMVTAGIFMVARMSPLYEMSETALSVILVIGAITAFFMGLLGLVQNDIKRVVAYSTLSQLGYMTVALGASAYAAGMFHLMTHAFFKALLFLGAGSVIIAMHHDQDIRNMGGLKKYMPITYWTALIGSLALIGFPGFAGFFSKDAIIEAAYQAYQAGRGGAGFAYYAVLMGVFITALYSFRMFFLVFHGKERMDEHTREHLHETPAVITLPLILLAIPSVFIGLLTLKPLLFSDFFSNAIWVTEAHKIFEPTEYHGVLAFIGHGMMQLPFWLAMAGLTTAYFLYLAKPELPKVIAQHFQMIYRILVNKYGFDEFYQSIFAGGTKDIGNHLWKTGDMKLIDGMMVNGTAAVIGFFSSIVRHLQTGYLYHYAFTMILGLAVLLGVFVLN